MVVGWMFGGAGCHEMNKSEEFLYKLGYLITAELFCPIRPIIRISWIFTYF